MSQVPTFLVNFFVERHNENPKNLPQDFYLSHSIMKKVTGKQMKPTRSFQHIDYVMERTCVQDRNAKGDYGQNEWPRVSTKLIARGERKKSM